MAGHLQYLGNPIHQTDRCGYGIPGLRCHGSVGGSVGCSIVGSMVGSSVGVGGSSVGGTSVVGGGSVNVGGGGGSVSVGGTVGGLVLVGGGGFVLVGEGSLVSVGGTSVRVGGIGVRLGPSLGRRVIVGSMVSDVKVAEGRDTSESVEVAFSVFVGTMRSSLAEVFVAVLNNVETAWIVNARSVLRVAVAVPPPVFGINRSESYTFCADVPVNRNGRPNPNPQVPRITIKINNSIFFTAVVPFWMQR